MILPNHSRGWLLAGVALVVALGPGCGKDNVDKPPPEGEVHIRKMAGLWSAYRSAHQGKPPKSTEQLTDWAKKLKPAELKKMGIDNLDDVLISPRDHEPYQVVSKPKMNRMGIASEVVYEKVGVGGKHLTAGTMGNVGFVTDEGAQELGGGS